MGCTAVQLDSLTNGLASCSTNLLRLRSQAIDPDQEGRYADDGDAQQELVPLVDRRHRLALVPVKRRRIALLAVCSKEAEQRQGLWIVRTAVLLEARTIVALVIDLPCIRVAVVRIR